MAPDSETGGARFRNWGHVIRKLDSETRNWGLDLETGTQDSKLGALPPVRRDQGPSPGVRVAGFRNSVAWIQKLAIGFRNWRLDSETRARMLKLRPGSPCAGTRAPALAFGALELEIRLRGFRNWRLDSETGAWI